MTETRIDLGLAPGVTIGRLTLLPAIRTIRRDDDQQEVIEPRVMQVLLALADKSGTIVRREELTERCWDGRVVGEDAINRVLSRLRRVEKGIGAGSFTIDTVTKVGYRLTLSGAGATAPTPGASTTQATVQEPAPPHVRPSRRVVIASAASGLTLAAAGLWWGLHKPEMSTAARDALDRGMNAFRQMSPDQLAAAIAAFHQATEAAPDFAEPWGKLALAYRWMYFYGHGREASINADRSRDAARKALRLDPDNGDAQAAIATLQPEFHNWLAYDAACKPVIARHPDEVGIGFPYIYFLSNVGGIRQLNDLSRTLVARDPGWPAIHDSLVISNWCLDRLDDADAAMDRAWKLWPRNVGVWFLRQRLLTYSGRAAAAVAMVEDADHRPTGLPSWEFDLAGAESQALLTQSKGDIDTAAELYWDKARTSVGVAGNAIQFFAATGRLDDAFSILNALYFNRGFDIGTRFFTEEQGLFSERRNRSTWMFWIPVMEELRGDPRTAAIVEEIGLADYWRKSGRQPDFPIAGFGPA